MFKRTLLATAVGLAAISVQAQDKPVDEELYVEGKYLAAEKANSIKSPTPIIDVPQSLSIITAEQIAEQGITSVAQIIDYTPGVNMSQGEGHRDSVVFRGVRSTADFFIDGVRDDVQYYRPLYNLEQVEILRGPNALLFGRGGTGGILNRVAKKGEIGENFTGYSAGIDSFGEHSVSLDSNTTLSETAAFRLNVMYEGIESDRDFNDGDRIGFNPTLRVQLSEDTTLDVSYEYMDHQRFIDRGIPTGSDGRPVEALSDVVFGDRSLNTTELEAHLFRAALQHNFSETLKGNLNAFYGDYDKLYQNFYASSYDEAATPDEVTLDGYLDTTQRENLVLSGNLVAEFETGDIGHTLITGLEYVDTSSNQDRYNAVWTPDENSDSDTEIFSINGPINLSGGVGVNVNGTTVTNSFSSDLNDDTHVDIEVVSFYIQDEIEISENLDIILGARFDSFDISVDDIENSAQASRKDEEISPRLGVVYKPQENISLYASYSESFLPRSGEQFASVTDLDPDVFENSEIGLKWDFESGLSLTVAYFDNEETSSSRDNTTGETFEERGLQVDGVEIQLQGRLTDNLSIQAGYTKLDGETADGEDPRELPDNMASIWTSYQANEKLGFGLGVVYQDDSLISDGSDLVLPSYTRVDAAVSYDVSEKLRVQLNIENLFDEDYYPNAHSTHQVTVGEPVNARLSLTGRF